MPCSAGGCCEIYEHSSGRLLSRKAILDALCQQSDLIYCRPSVSKARLLLWQQWVDDWFGTSVGVSLEDVKRDIQQRYGTVTLRAPNGFSGLRMATINTLLQIFRILLACAGSEEIAKPRCENRSGVEYKLREDGIQSRRLSWLQAPEGSSKFLWAKRVRDTVALRCWDLP